jgi:hypothetical protein
MRLTPKDLPLPGVAVGLADHFSGMHRRQIDEQLPMRSAAAVRARP